MRVALVLHVQPLVARKHEAAQHPACRVEFTRDDGAGDEQVAAAFGFVDEAVATHLRRDRASVGSPAR